MDLGEAGVGHGRAALVRAPDRRDVAAHRVGGEEVDVAVAARGEDHRVGGVRLELAGDQVAGDDPAGSAVDQDDVEQLVAGVHACAPLVDLVLEGGVGAEQELLAGLAAAVEGALHEHAAERARGKNPAVLAVEGHALGDGLVDDVGRELREPPDVRLAGAEVAALHRVDEQPAHRVALVRVVLGCVDAALGRDRVGPAGGVLEAEGVDRVALLGEGRGGAGPGESGADHDDLVVVAPAGADQPVGVQPREPLLVNWALGDPGVEVDGTHRCATACGAGGSGRMPK